MSRFNRRLRDHKRAVHPVIAVIVLIAVTLVLALVVGAYTFGLFGSNAKTITVTSATLYAAGSFEFALNDPGSQTLITQIVMTSGSGGSVSLGASSISIGGTSGDNTVSGGVVSSISVTVPTTATNWALTSGQTYSFVITFQNGQSITGSSIAQ